MNKKFFNNELFNSAHLVILISFTLFSVALVCESIFMGWELPAVVIIIVALIISWVMHMGQMLTDNARMWIYSLLMMGAFFFYGTHLTSTFDLASVIAIVMIIYIMTGRKKLIVECMVTYYITMTYDIIAILMSGYRFTGLEISRIMLHLFVVALGGFVSFTVINKWGSLFEKTGERVEELADSTRRLNDFLANVSHEIRTPINAILGLTGVCIEKEKDEEIKNEMAAVRGAGHRISEQINDILDYSEIDKGSLVVNRENYMIQSVINDIIVEINDEREPDVELVINVDKTVPSIMHTDITKLKRIFWHLISNGIKYTKKGGVYVYISAKKHEYGVNLCIEVTDTGKGMDAKELERVFEGFYQGDSSRTRSSNGLGLGLSIADGFARALGGFMKIESKEGVGTTVSVSIPQKVVDGTSVMTIENPEKVKIVGFLDFDKFSVPAVRDFYDKTVKNSVEDLGVSMHRVNNIDDLKQLLDSIEPTHLFVAEEEYNNNRDYIESLTNSILVCVIGNPTEAHPDKSRVLWLNKPFYNCSVISVLRKTVEDAFEKELRMKLEGVEVLVVDDEPMNLQVARMIFGKYGMKVYCASSGFESIEKCREKQFDIIFMDHMMPEMDGVEAMKQIRAVYKPSGADVPIVALTANAVSTAREMFISEGFDGFVSKPIEFSELERVMKNVIPKNLISYERIEDDPVDEKEKNASTAGGPDQKAAVTESPLEGLNAIGIDTERGLMYSGNDEKFYLSLLEEYASESEKKVRELDSFVSEKDLASYAIKAHSIKSTSKMIGINELSETAKMLETAAKAGDEDIVEAAHEGFLRKYEKMMTDINAICDFSRGVTGTDAGQASDDDEIIEFMPE